MTTKFIQITFSFALMMTLVQCNQQKAKNTNNQTVISQDSLIKKGAYLVTILGCNDCHSPKRMSAHGPELIP